ncbi:sulfotransferase family protein [Gluconacetobacter takamatsuzukensis]|uniref:Sulfotransferase family protein n=1 Tax=Gluconacetobacter takamatsuzukensis TaxID=1286190 RepID=A0A7W4KFZ6_9PROT|nr:sulfotransferase [Gluconacetobacter takamatsuzukensis]MBB2206226.1 hypothetical protein [Gluconacetobacter takamatsuzukensis]
MKKKQIIVVLGMHRSGTSAITYGLRAMGVSLGDHLLPAAADNGKGFWEDLDFIDLNTEMLAALGRDWRSLQSVTDQDVDCLRASGYVSKSLQLLKEKTANVSAFGFKDPRTTKLLPFWKRIFEESPFDVKYILASRNPLSVVRSLGKRDDLPREVSYMLWLEYMMAALCNLGDAHAVLVDYDTLVSAPGQELKRVSDRLGLVLDPQEVEKYCDGFIEKDLRHTHFDRNDVCADDAAVPLVQDVYSFLLDVQAGRTSIEAGMESGLFRKWKDRLDRTQPLLKLIDRWHIDIENASDKIEAFEINARASDMVFGRIIAILKTVNRSGRRAWFRLRTRRWCRFG